MRNNYFKVFLTTVILSTLLMGISQAQPPEERGPRPDRGERFLDRIPDLTDEQAEQIKDLRTAHMKEILPLRNLVEEKQARLQTISTAEKVDIAKINETIDEIGELKITIAKKREAHKQAIRKILTEDQRVVFDSKMKTRGHHKGFKSRSGHPCREMRPGNRF